MPFELRLKMISVWHLNTKIYKKKYKKNRVLIHQINIFKHVNK